MPRDHPRAHTQWLVAHARAILVVTMALAVAGVVFASRLTISTDLWSLLPPDYPSVQSLKQLSKRVGGSSQLTIVVESPDPLVNQRFAEQLVQRIRERLGDQIVTIDYKIDAIRAFYESHAALFLSLPELTSTEQELAAAIAEKKRKASPLPFDLGLDDPPASDAPKATDAIEARLRKAMARFDRYPSGYYTGEEGRVLAIFVRPTSSGSDAKNARPFLRAMEALVAELEPARVHPGLRVGFTGSFQIALDENEGIKRDLISTAGLCIGLIALVVIGYFRSLRVFFMLGATLLGGTSMAFGLAWLAIGYLNIQTAFLGSLIMGTGINYGIILMARYLEERRAGQELTAALTTAITTTALATGIAAATTIVSFATLLSSSISSFQQFAIIGGGGILFCWLLSFTFLPALIATINGLGTRRHRSSALPRWLVAWPAQHPLWTATLGVAIALAGAIGFVRYLPRALQTDARELRNRSSLESGPARLSTRVAAFRPTSGSPALVVTESLDDARLVCQVINERFARLGPTASPTGTCRSIFDLLPNDQAKKLVVAARLKATLAALPTELLDPELRRTLATIDKKLSLEPLTLESLPEELVRSFRERDGHLGRVVSIDPPPGRNLWVAENLFAFADALRRIELPDGRILASSGDSVIFADILREIQKDAPRTTAAALLGVIVIVGLVLRAKRGAAHVIVSLLVGVAWMVGVQALLDVKLNFLNFVALPTTFGIAADYSVNIYLRYTHNRGARRERMIDSLRGTGAAVVLCSMTTIIGYFTLIIADNLALVSFGKLAMLGEIACLLSAMIVLPATILLDDKAR